MPPLNQTTALQELIEWFRTEQDKTGSSRTIEITLATELLSKERQQIIDAVNKTYESTEFQKDGDGYLHCPFDGKDYFEQTFKQ